MDGPTTHSRTAIWWPNPDSYIEIGAERRAVYAVTAGPDERARLWPKPAELYADFDNYQS